MGSQRARCGDPPALVSSRILLERFCPRHILPEHPLPSAAPHLCTGGVWLTLLPRGRNGAEPGTLCLSSWSCSGPACHIMWPALLGAFGHPGWGREAARAIPDRGQGAAGKPPPLRSAGPRLGGSRAPQDSSQGHRECDPITHSSILSAAGGDRLQGASEGRGYTDTEIHALGPARVGEATGGTWSSPLEKGKGAGAGLEPSAWTTAAPAG